VFNNTDVFNGKKITGRPSITLYFPVSPKIDNTRVTNEAYIEWCISDIINIFSIWQIDYP